MLSSLFRASSYPCLFRPLQPGIFWWPWVWPWGIGGLSVTYGTGAGGQRVICVCRGRSGIPVCVWNQIIIHVMTSHNVMTYYHACNREAMNLVCLESHKGQSRRCWWSRRCSRSLRSFEWRCLVVGENNVARVISMQNIFHDGCSTSSHQLLNSTEEI